MRLKAAGWIAAAGFAACIAAGDATASTSQQETTIRVNSLSGAYLAARIAETDNDLDAAIAYYRRAHAFDPDNRTIQQSLLLGLISQGEFDEALPFADSLKETPEVERFSRLALATDAIRKGEFADAEHLLKLALSSDLDKLITGLMTGWAKLGAGDSDGALAFLDGLSGPEWYNLFVGFHRGLVAEQAGEMARARAAYEAVTADEAAGSAAPEAYLRALEAHAGFLARQGEGEAALAVLERAEAFAPGRVTVQAMRDRIENGEAVAPLVPGAAEGAAEALLNLATALNRSGGESFVRLYLQYAVALRPDNDTILIQLAGIAEQQGDSLNAIAYYEKIPDDSPMKVIAELQLGLNLADLERFEEAEAHLKEALARDEDDMRAYLALGGVHARQENFRAAADLYEKAVARIGEPERQHWNIFYQRGIAHERLKEWDRAEPNFLRALELFPDQPQVLNYLGYSWVDMNINLDEGLDLIQRAVDLRPSDGYIVDSLGWAFYRLGRYEDATRELERAVALMPADPILNDHLGDAYWHVGRKREAVFQWRHAREMEPEPELLAEIERKLDGGLPKEAAAEPQVMVAEGPGGDNAALAEAAVPVEGETETTGDEAGAPEEMAEEAEPEAAPEPAAATDDSVQPEADAAAEADATGGDGNVHIVEPGQSLWGIAADRLGNGERFREIIELNPALQADPDTLYPGQRLTLPDPVR